MNTRFQNSRYRSPAFSMSPSGPYSGPRSSRISEHGPHGPGTPIDQKLSFMPSRTIRSSGRPTRRFHKAMASRSSWNTLTQSRDSSNPYPPSAWLLVTRSHASSMAVSLK